MRIFRYWSQIEREVFVGTEAQNLRFYGGSNTSQEEAQRDALRRYALVRERIAGHPPSDPDYEVDVREEIVMYFNSRHIVTRNRYGAEVLNTAGLMFVDIDRPKWRWYDLFRGSGTLVQRKQRILDFVRQRAAQPAWQGPSLRVYETHSGMRILVNGREFDPHSPETAQRLADLNADGLYAALCRRQGCFRARLTPKPYRMKLRPHRVIFPRLTPLAESSFAAWLADYDRARRNFAVCRWLCTLGPESISPIVDHHDTATGAFDSLPLA